MKYGFLFVGAVGVLFVALLAGCDKFEELPNEEAQEEETDNGFITLEEVAQLLSTVPLGREQVAEVQEGSTSSAGNGYDDEYRMRDLFSSPGSGVGADPTTKASSYSRPLRELLREAAEARFATKSASGDASAWLDSLAASDVQIYWPGAEEWDGSQLPVITYDPGDGAERNEGYELLPDGSVKKLMVDEQMSLERPVWVVNRNSDADYKSLELRRREDPNWGNGGGDILVTKADDGFRTLVLRSFKAHRQYDSWFAGGAEILVKFGAVETVKAGTDAELLQYQANVTDFMIVVRRNQVGQELPFNAVLVSDWSKLKELQLEQCALLMVEDDGGTQKTWEFKTTVKYNSKAYGVEIEMPLNSRDDIIWRGPLTPSFIEKKSGIPVGFGDVELVLELI
jgi:hypothetical protein